MGVLFLPGLFSRHALRTGFDPRAEQSRMAEVVVRSAALLVRSEDDAQALIGHRAQRAHCHRPGLAHAGRAPAGAVSCGRAFAVRPLAAGHARARREERAGAAAGIAHRRAARPLRAVFRRGALLRARGRGPVRGAGAALQRRAVAQPAPGRAEARRALRRAHRPGQPQRAGAAGARAGPRDRTRPAGGRADAGHRPLQARERRARPPRRRPHAARSGPAPVRAWRTRSARP